MLAAVTDLVAARDSSTVTVTDVVRAAGVTRPTFYAAFGDLQTAFARAALTHVAEAFAYDEPARPAADEPEAHLRATITRAMERLEPHASFFAHVLDGAGGPAVQAQLTVEAARQLGDDAIVGAALRAGPLPLRRSTEALAAAISWELRTWFHDEDRPPPAQFAASLAALVCRLVFGGLAGGPAALDPAEGDAA